MPNTPGSEVVVVGNVGIDTNVFLPSSPDLIDGLREEGHFTSNVDYLGQAGGYTSRGFAALGVRTVVHRARRRRPDGSAGCARNWPATAST